MDLENRADRHDHPMDLVDHHPDLATLVDLSTPGEDLGCPADLGDSLPDLAPRTCSPPGPRDSRGPFHSGEDLESPEDLAVAARTSPLAAWTSTVGRRPDLAIPVDPSTPGEDLDCREDLVNPADLATPARTSIVPRTSMFARRTSPFARWTSRVSLRTSRFPRTSRVSLRTSRVFVPPLPRLESRALLIARDLVLRARIGVCPARPPVLAATRGAPLRLQRRRARPPATPTACRDRTSAA